MLSFRPASKITFIYLTVASLWIYLSDKAMVMLFDFESPQQQMVFSISKGIIYIIITSFLLYKLIRTFYKKIDDRITDLQEKQNELTELQKLTTTGLWEIDAVTNKTEWSEVSREIFEVEKNFEPHPESIANYIQQEINKDDVLNFFKDVVKKRVPFDIQLPIITAKGNEKWIGVIGNPLIQDEKCIKVFGSFQDISEAKNKEAKLLQLNRLYDFIRQTTKMMVHATDSNILFNEICRIAVNVGQFKMAWIGKLNETSQTVDPVAQAGEENGYLSRIQIVPDGRKAEGLGPTGFALREGRHFVCNDIENDPSMKPWKEYAMACGYRSSIALPIIKFGKVLGTFTLYAGSPYYFDEKEIELLKGATAAISYSLEYIEEEKLRREADINLAESEERYRKIVETSSEGIWQLDKDHHTVFVNDRMAQMLGYENREEIIGKSGYMFLADDEIFRAQQKVENRKRGLSESYEIKYVKKDGTHLWVWVNVSPLFTNGEFTGSFAMVTNITERKEAEIRIKEALERYDTLSNATMDTVWDWDIKSNKIYYNQGLTETFGYPTEKIVNDISWSDMNFHPNDLKNIQRSFAEAFAEKKVNIQTEYRYRCADGVYKYVVDRAFIKYDADGVPVRALGIMQDITSDRDHEILIEKAVNDTQEKERQQIGMELHDNVNQILSASLLYLGILKERIANDPRSIDDFNNIDHFLRNAIDEIRKLSHQLAPVAIKDISLKVVIEDLIQTVNANHQFKIKLDIENIENTNTPSDFKINLYRILQEQLNNIVKYAKATEVTVSLIKENNYIKFRIADNGKGFDIKTKRSGIGIENMKRRAKLLSGEFAIISAPGEGCEVTVDIPVNILNK